MGLAMFIGTNRICLVTHRPSSQILHKQTLAIIFCNPGNMLMPNQTNQNLPETLEQLPGIGKRLMEDLRALGILTPTMLSKFEPLVVYRRIENLSTYQHDPCIFYTLLSFDHFFKTGEAKAWWFFADLGKQCLTENS